MVRFLHIADLHLGMRITRFSPEVVRRIREARFRAIEKIRELVRRPSEGFQFVVLAGDLFDDVRVERTISDRAFALLESFPVPVLVITGNHDPLQPGTLWDSAPWAGQQTKQVRLLRDSTPVEVMSGVTVFPCPVFRKTSADNPTQWIASHSRTAAQGIRIGIAHGTVMDRPNLPTNDHPISPTAATDLDLDYLALGHWHGTKMFRDGNGHSRIVYPGVHEPMRFQGDAASTGWRPYAAGGERDEFFDNGKGTAISVTINGPGDPPTVEERDVGAFRWTVRDATVHSEEELDTLIDAVAGEPDPERTLLRLRLSGVVPLRALKKVESLREVLGRYVVEDLDDSRLVVEPTDDEIREVVGDGILKSVFDRLRELPGDGTIGNGLPADAACDPAIRRHASLLLYRYALQVGNRS